MHEALSAVSDNRNMIEDGYLDYTSRCGSDESRNNHYCSEGSSIDTSWKALGGICRAERSDSLPLYSLSSMYAFISPRKYAQVPAISSPPERGFGELCSIAKYSRVRVRSSCFILGTKMLFLRTQLAVFPYGSLRASPTRVIVRIGPSSRRREIIGVTRATL